jgi:hypothetical protein
MATRSDKTAGQAAEQPDDKNAGKLGYKVMTLVGSMAGATIARKVLTTVWTKATGKEPPDEPENPEVRWGEAVSWAAASGAVVALTKVLAKRRVAATWQRASGELPPGVEPAKR